MLFFGNMGVGGQNSPLMHVALCNFMLSLPLDMTVEKHYVPNRINMFYPTQIFKINIYFDIDIINMINNLNSAKF